MEIQVKTSSPDEEVTLPLNGEVYACVSWGDDNTQEVKNTFPSHRYSEPGTYLISISGTVTWFGRQYHFPALTKVQQWGDLKITSLAYAFFGAKNLTEVPDSLPGTVTDLSYMFRSAIMFNHPIASWITSNVTNMRGMFNGATAFNQPITWDTTNVTNMHGMFELATTFNQSLPWKTGAVTDMAFMFSDATAFNQPIGDWDTSKVTDMHGMFQYDKGFNQDIGRWNTSSVTDMKYMFSGATAFNKPINWDTSAVTDMYLMFNGATAFNQPIGTWDTGAVTGMQSMFKNAIAFNQNIGSWDIRNVGSMTNMFNSARLSPANYDALLIGWANQTRQSGVTFDGGTSKYTSAGIVARATLQVTWTITDGGLLPTITFQIPVKKVGDKPFLVQANSDSNGAFTYTSSNLSVATTSGATVSIVGAGTTTITATQAAAGDFNEGSVTALLTVVAVASSRRRRARRKAFEYFLRFGYYLRF
jgi:surface protein